MNVSRLKKPELIAELEKRSLPTNGLKDELKSRLIEAMEKEKADDVINVDESDDSPGESIQSDNEDKIPIDIPNDEDKRLDFVSQEEKTLKEDEIIAAADQSTILTVEDAIKMKTPHEMENDSMVVNINDDGDNNDNESVSHSPPHNDNDSNEDEEEDNVSHSLQQTINNSNRELDNGDHEIIEISEEVVIDDEDNQENDTNYNELSSDSNQQHQSRDTENELAKIESRKEDPLKTIQSKTELWVTNIAEDVKAVELKELFGNFGKVVSAKVVMNAKNPSGSCFGCIQLASPGDAKACIANLDHTEFRGNIISISNDMNDKTISKEKVVRNVSPVSSSASWGSKKKIDERKSSKTPLNSPISSYNKNKTDPNEKDKRPTTYREKPSTGSGYYKTKEFSDRGAINRRGNRAPQYNDDRRRDYPSDRGGKSYYKSSNVNYNSTGGNSYSNSRNRESSFSKPRDNRDNYNSHSFESRYTPSHRDSGRDKLPRSSDAYGSYRGGVHKAPTNYNDYHSRPTSKYESYDEYERRDKRPIYDRAIPRELDNYPTSKRDIYKRPRPEETDEYLQSKKRKTEFINEKPQYYRSIDSPKKSYYSEKDYRKPEYKSRRDDYPNDYPSKSERELLSHRRTVVDYPIRREGYDGFSPERHISRSNHYRKDSYAQNTDFGGRSRRY